MADVDAFHQEENIFGDVGGVIGDALQVMGDEHQIHRARGQNASTAQSPAFLPSVTGR